MKAFPCKFAVKGRAGSPLAVDGGSDVTKRRCLFSTLIGITVLESLAQDEWQDHYPRIFD